MALAAMPAIGFHNLIRRGGVFIPEYGILPGTVGASPNEGSLNSDTLQDKMPSIFRELAIHQEYPAKYWNP